MGFDVVISIVVASSNPSKLSIVVVSASGVVTVVDRLCVVDWVIDVVVRCEVRVEAVAVVVSSNPSK